MKKIIQSFDFAKKKNRRRYKLHYLLRKQGVILNALQRTIYFPFDIEKEAIPKQAIELRDTFNYSLQLELK